MFEWFGETVGLNFGEIERRWKEFPVFPVPQHLSDKHGLDSHQGLFGYLDQVRLSYIIGAEFAAIVMCRTNKILHDAGLSLRQDNPNDHIGHRDPAQGLVIEWTKVLLEMINRAPLAPDPAASGC